MPSCLFAIGIIGGENRGEWNEWILGVGLCLFILQTNISKSWIFGFDAFVMLLLFKLAFWFELIKLFAFLWVNLDYSSIYLFFCCYVVMLFFFQCIYLRNFVQNRVRSNYFIIFMIFVCWVELNISFFLFVFFSLLVLLFL